jgi:hypothetical protein
MGSKASEPQSCLDAVAGHPRIGDCCGGNTRQVVTEREERPMIRKAETIAMTILLAAVYCNLALGRVTQTTLLRTAGSTPLERV